MKSYDADWDDERQSEVRITCQTESLHQHDKVTVMWFAAASLIDTST